MLEFKTKRPKKGKALTIYGKHGIGKTLIGSQFESPLFFLFEDGLPEEMEIPFFDIPSEYKKVESNISTLIKEEHDRKTLVFDTVDWLEKLIFQQVCIDENVDSIEKIGYAKGYQYALRYWSRILKGIDILRKEKLMDIVFLAHSQIKSFSSPIDDSYDRYTLALHKDASRLIQEYSDAVLFADYEIFTIKTDEGFNKKKTKGSGTGKRVLYCEERPGYDAKNRFYMPEKIDLNINEIYKYLKR